jgi:hypothetical protein
VGGGVGVLYVGIVGSGDGLAVTCPVGDAGILDDGVQAVIDEVSRIIRHNRRAIT